MKNGIAILVSILAIGIISGSTFVKDDCDELRKENEKLKMELKNALASAEQQRKIAEAASMEARRQEQLAREAARRAIESRDEARLLYENAVKKNKAVQDSLKRSKQN